MRDPAPTRVGVDSTNDMRRHASTTRERPSPAQRAVAFVDGAAWRLSAFLIALVAAACESPAAPISCGPLPQVTVNVGETSTVTACFDDANGDLLSYTASSADPSVATTSLSGTSITVTAVAPGNTTVAVTASDPGGLQGHSSFRVMVPNRAPQPQGTVPNVTVQVGRTATVDASQYFTEPDGQALTYAAVSSDVEVASASAAGSTITVAAEAKGGANITITATDPGGLSATQMFRITVPNRPPEPVGGIDAQTIEVGESVALDVADSFTDPDGDALTYTAASSDAEVASAGAAGSTITVAAEAKGGANITITATDPGGLSATQMFRVTVPNRPPEPVGGIDARTIEVGESVTLDIADSFTDPDGDALSYTATSSIAAVARTSVSGSQVTITAVSGPGTSVITITATDDEQATATQQVSVTVPQPNRAPRRVGSIPAQTVEVGGRATVNVARYFSDPDGDALTYSATSSNASVARASVSGSTVTIAGASVGTATVTVTARDPDGLTATQTARVTVPQPNRAPRPVGTIASQTITAGGSTTVNASAYFSDPDGDALTYSATSSNASVARASVSGSTLTIAAASAGSATVTLTARDPDGLSAAQQFSVTVRPAGRPDLVVSVSPTRLNASPGETIRVTFTVRNRGNAVSPATTLRVLESRDATISTGDLALGQVSVSALAAGGSISTEGLTIALPSNASGTRYYGGCVDAVSRESRTSNNCSSALRVTVGSPGAPDLVVSVSPTSVNASPGDTIPVTFTVSNRGDAAAPATTLRVLESSDATISTGDSEFGQVSVAALAAGGSVSSEGVAVILSSSATGTLYFGACADAVSGESNTGNNCSSAVTVTVGGTGAPDLEFTTVTPTSVNASPGDTVRARFTLRNSGNATAAATTIRIYASSNSSIATSDTELESFAAGSLAAGRSTTLAVSARLASSTPAGTFYLGLCVDAVSGESDTSNNCSEGVRVTVSGSGAPDLEWTSVTPTSVTGSSGDTVRAAFTLGNTGDAAAAATTVRLYQSSDATISTSDTELGSAAQSSLAAGQSVTRNPGVILGSGSGTIYFGLCVDAVSGESDTGNNCSDGVRVTKTGSNAPDLVVSVSKSSVTVVAGSSFSYDVTVRNQGDAAAAATLLRIFVSADATISTGDTQFGDPTNVPALAVSEEATGTRTIATRAGSAGTTGYIGECVDAVSGESNTNNNCSSAILLTITSSSSIAAAPQGDGGLQATHPEMSLNRAQPDAAAATGIVAGVILRSHPGTELEASGEDGGGFVGAAIRIEMGMILEPPAQGEDERLRLLVRPGGARP